MSLVASTGEAVIVEENGEPVAVVVSPADYQRFQQQERERLWAVVDAVGKRNADLDPDEVLRDVTEVVEAVRQELYEERKLTGERRR